MTNNACGGRRLRIGRMLIAIALAVIVTNSSAFGDEVRVVSSGATAAAYFKLAPEFERTTKHKTITVASQTGVGPESIPNRVRRGDPIDVVILSSNALDELIKDGYVIASSRVDLARSSIASVYVPERRSPTSVPSTTSSASCSKRSP